MVVREMFDNELKNLHQKLIHMSQLSIERLSESVDALANHDVALASKIKEADAEINKLEEEINDAVILTIARQQPVATDLRRLMVLVKIAGDMERVGDYAVNIAKETERIGSQEHLTQLPKIQEMKDKTVNILRLTLDAFIAEDVEQAQTIAKLDDEIDKMYGELIRDLLGSGVSSPDQLPQITQLAFICRYLERSADHATNMAEQLLYLRKGKHIDLN
ncbi:phosphate signaling complex protein PhoU [Chryseomicrobium sp. FSL W7-1435]|uniref:phosphate signaling complex protein PhoU n=1 Tax=Chryseomicrobium sp. FSL W7-1435 TaxID=2921704 RepID=UPI00315A331F